MRVRRFDSSLAECDMTPMIDMTFQLLAFFMVLVNFSEADQNERIKLPKSVLAKPPDRPVEHPITLQLTDKSSVIYGMDEFPITALPTYLRRERAVIESERRNVADANIIIRGDRVVPAGKVQELIKVCQENGFERFILRAMEAIE